VSSLARPGGNMTGSADIQTVIAPKRLEALRQTVPRATRFGVLSSANAPSSRPCLDVAATTAEKLGIHLVTVGASTVADFDGAFAAMARDRVGGVLVHASSLTVRHDPRRLADVALKHRLPTMFGAREHVVTGGLMSDAPDHLDLTRRSAVYIDKILKRGPTSRAAGRTGVQVPADHQRQDGQGVESADPGVAAGAGE